MSNDLDRRKLGCLLMMVLTDGGVNNDEIYFVTTDDILARYFTNLVERLWNKTPKKIVYKRNKYSWMKLRVRNREISELIKNLTNDKTRIPDFIMNENSTEILGEYLRIVASTDGGVVFYKTRRRDNYTRTERHIIIGCKNHNIRKQLQLLFSKLGIKTRVVKEGIRISGKENLESFQNKVGFIPGCRVTSKSPRWKGYTKNNVLKLMLESYSGLAAPRNSVR